MIGIKKLRQSQLLLLRRLLPCLLWAATPHLAANTSEMVTAVGESGGDFVWKIVTHSASSETPLSPGVYSRGDNHNWDTPLVSGNVLGRKNASGLMQLALTEKTHRLESWAVVDGKITFFHINSSPSRPDSLIVVGDEVHPLIDPSLPRRRQIAMPNIASLNDMTYIAQRVQGKPRGQDLIFSVKNPRPPFMGMGLNGLTFVLRLSGEDGLEDRMALTRPIYVLDYVYHTSEELEGLRVDDGYIALNKINDLSQISQTDPYVVQAWKKDLEEKLARKDYRKLPYFDPVKGAYIFRKNPQLDLSMPSRYAPVNLQAVYYVDGRAHRLMISKGRLEEVLYGELAFDEKRLAKVSNLAAVNLDQFVLFKHNHEQSAIFYFNGHLYYLESLRDRGIALVKIDAPPLDSTSPEQFSFSVVHRLEGKTYLIVSAQQGSTAQTKAYELRFRQGRYELDKSIPLDNRFYSMNELDERTYVEEKEVYFDGTTEVGPNESYRHIYEKTVPHLLISNSCEDNSLTVGFRYPLSKTPVAAGIIYQTFNSRGSATNYNGLYRKDPQGRYKVLQLGELLPPPKTGITTGDQSSVDLTNFITSYEVSDGRQNVQLRAVILDSRNQHGEESFTVTVLANPIGDGVLAESRSFTFNYPYAELEGFFFHGGGSPSATTNHVGILMARKEQNLDERQSRLTKIDFLLNRPIDCPREGSCNAFNLLSTNSVNFDPEFHVDFLAVRDRFVSSINTALQEGTLEDVFYGELLTSPRFLKTMPETTSLSIGEATLDSKTLSTGGIMGDERVKVSVFAIDRNCNGGRYSFDLVVKAENQAHNKVQYYARTFKVPFRALTGLSLHANESLIRPHENFGLIYTLDFDSLKIGTFDRPGFHALFFKIVNGGRPAEALFFEEPKDLSLEAVEHASIEDISFKLLADSNGTLYWPANNKPRSHRLFEVKNLFTGSNARPVQAGLQLSAARSVSEFVQYREEGSWRVRKAATTLGKTAMPGFFTRLAKEDLEDYRNILFGDLEEELVHMATPRLERRHKVLLVSKEVKKYVLSAIAGKWLLPVTDGEKAWGYHNKQLALYYLNEDKIVDQDLIHKNFQGMTYALEKNEIPVLIGDLSDILSVGTPRQGDVDKPYIVEVPEEESSGRTSDAYSVPEEVTIGKRAETPSLLYILASEGRRIPLEGFTTRGQAEIGMLFIGTPDEWAQTKNTLSVFERSSQVLDDFEEISLETPSLAQRRQLLGKILDEKAPLFKGIRYEGTKIFRQSARLSPEEVQEKVIDYAVSRSHALAQERGENVFVSFVKLLNKFKTSLNPAIMQEKSSPLVMDKAFIENIVSDLYGLPLNLRSLPSSDPLNVLARKDAPMRLNDAGYSGNFDIKMRIIRGILGQTNGGDQKTIPASFVLFGKKGSGKTFFFTTLIKMLGLKYYDFSSSDDENSQAQVFLVNLGNITTTGISTDTETMPVRRLIEHFDAFLKLPHGKRGFILFDDAHLSSDEVRGQVFAKLRSLFEAKDGRYMGVNVRNLTLFMTFNPTIDREKIKKVVDASETATPLQLTLATFMGDDNKVDESFFNRWGDIINLDYFSTSAKGNELVHKLSESAKSHFNLNNTYFTVGESVIDRIVNRFPTLNARDFLSSAVKSLAHLVASKSDEEALYMIAPKGAFSGSPSPVTPSKEEGSSEAVSAFVAEQFYAVPVNKETRGYILFLDLLVSSLRINIYNNLIDSINSHPEIAGNETSQKLRLSPILQAVKAHLHEHPSIPLTELSLDLFEVKKRLKLSGFDRFDEYLESLTSGQPAFFPKAFRQANSNNNVAEYLLGATDNLLRHPSRLSLLYKYWQKLRVPLDDYLHHLMQNGARDYKAAAIPAWAERLKPTDVHLLASDTDRIAELLLAFVDEFITDLKLIENIEVEQFDSASTYDTTRVFLLALDRSLTLLNWDRLSVFVITALETFAEDMSIATIPGVQHWLFEAQRSLIQPASRENVFEKIKSSLLGVGDWDTKQERRQAASFDAKVDKLFDLVED